MHSDIAIEAGGDHQFDLGHLKREGGARLVQFLLQSAGFHSPVQWRLRVEKKVQCSGETRPVTVVSSKPWCCYLKIKPGDNNTAHFCSLLMPDGFRGDTVYDALKDVEEDVGRAWRFGNWETKTVPESESAAAIDRIFPTLSRPDPTLPPRMDVQGANGNTTPETPVADEASSAPWATTSEAVNEDDDSTALHGWTKDPERLRETLIAIEEVSNDSLAVDLERFVNMLTVRLGWHGLRRKQIGGIFTALVRRGYLEQVRRGTVRLGYRLTGAGNRIIRDKLGMATRRSAARVAATPVADPAKLMVALTDIMQRYTTACQKLQENRTRRAELAAELATLDAEADELGEVVNDREIQTLLQRLIGKQPPATTAEAEEADEEE